MNIDKSILHRLIIEQLDARLNNAKLAASQAYETATHEENKAENKYDTLGLEAAYLAEGQSKRVIELEQDLLAFQSLGIKYYDNDMPLGMSALVCLNTGLTNKTQNKYFFISPVSGGTNVHYQTIGITLISPASPLGKALIGSFLGDDIMINNLSYEIAAIW